jgi:hypothetical protein
LPIKIEGHRSGRLRVLNVSSSLDGKAILG